MHSFWRGGIALAAVAAALPSILFAQRAGAPVILEAAGNTIEVVGLRRWTVAMIQDSLAKYSPGDSLHTHGCAAALRYKLGFADAAVMGYQTRVNHTHTVIVVREPQDSALVRYRPASFDTTGVLPRYGALMSLYRADPRAFHAALAEYPQHRAGRLAEPVMSRDAARARQVWRELARHATAAEHRRALGTLRSDPSIYNRTFATAVLANFPGHDRTWHALVEAMRESDGMVKGVASELARNMSIANPRVVEWTPVLSSLRAMLDGTGLFHTNALMETLINTGLARRHANGLLGGGQGIVFDLAAVSVPPVRDGARAFLRHMSDVDHGENVAAWRTWAATLPAVDLPTAARQ